MGDVAPLRGGYAFKSSEYKKDGTPIVRISNILPDGSIGADFACYDDMENDENISLRNGDALLAMSGATTGKVSILKCKNTDKYYQNQRVGYFKRNIQYNYDFVSTIVRSDLFKEQLMSVLVAGAQPNVSSKEIDSFEFVFPLNIEEQKKIGQYFANLDTLITLHQRKCEETKKLKKYMLQKMFPQNGKRVPEIRFVGFTEDWEQRKVKEFAIESEVKGHSGKDAKKLTVKLHNKGVYVADEKIQGSDNTQYYIRRAGQFIYGKQNFFNGAIGIVPKKLDKYESTKDVPAFDVSSDVNVDWLYYYIARPEIYKPQEALCTGTGSKRFHVNNFYNLSLAIPKMDEQIKIKEYFVHLDNLITLHQRKYEELQKIKKFMLQNMFI